MALVLTQHEEGCIPFRRCRACKVADIISETCVKEVVELFNAGSESPQFEPGVHMPGCSPINPCFNCESVALLKRHFSDTRLKLLLELMDQTKSLEMHQRECDPAYARLKDLLMRSVDSLDLSIRSANAFRNADMRFVGDICRLTQAELMRTPNFGRKSLDEVKEVLALMGLRLGMEFPSDIFSPA